MQETAMFYTFPNLLVLWYNGPYIYLSIHIQRLQAPMSGEAPDAM